MSKKHSTLAWGKRFITASCMLVLFGVVSAAGRSKNYSKDPKVILDQVMDKADTHIIETPLNQVYNNGVYGLEYKIANTLDEIRNNVPVYVQRLVFVALVIGALLIIYNGFLLTMSPLSEVDAAKVQKRIVYIAIGVAVVSAFYFIIKISLSVLLKITG